MTAALFAGLRAPATSPLLRLASRSSLCRGCTPKFPSFRFSSTVTKQNAKPSKPPKPFVPTTPTKPLYPERLLIYNAGTGRTAFVGFCKIAAIVAFAWGCLIVAPSLYYDSNVPWWAAGVAIILSPIPVLIISTATSPFVNSIYLHLPAYARNSAALLERYASALPPTARLDLVTVRLSGNAKTTGSMLSELRLLNKERGWRNRLSLANVIRVAAPTQAAAHVNGKKTGGAAKKKTVKQGPQVQAKGRTVVRRFVDIFVEPRRRFYIDAAKGSRRSKAPGVIEQVMKAVAQKPTST